MKLGNFANIDVISEFYAYNYILSYLIANIAMIELRFETVQFSGSNGPRGYQLLELTMYFTDII